MKCGEKSSNQMIKKKTRPVMHHPGRIQKKCNINWRNKSQELFSTSPDSPIHAGAVAGKPIPVVRTNPMYQHMEGVCNDETDGASLNVRVVFIESKIAFLFLSSFIL